MVRVGILVVEDVLVAADVLIRELREVTVRDLDLENVEGEVEHASDHND